MRPTIEAWHIVEGALLILLIGLVCVFLFKPVVPPPAPMVVSTNDAPPGWRKDCYEGVVKEGSALNPITRCQWVFTWDSPCGQMLEAK